MVKLNSKKLRYLMLYCVKKKFYRIDSCIDPHSYLRSVNDVVYLTNI